ncbi:MAG: hypothetical protein NXI30_05725 [bacterium]|nr:hypothetical protein [bacterium]
MRVSKIEPRRRRARRSRASLALRLMVAAALLAAYSAALILFGMFVFRAFQPRNAPDLQTVAVRELPARMLSIGRNHLRASLDGETFERLHLDIKFKHLEKLRAKRAEAMATGVLMAADDDLVPAEIRHGDRTIRTRIRLKGDALDHLHGDKWSFRVAVRGSDQLFGMRRFSLQSPSVRDYQAEPVFLEHLRSEGILTPRYRFVNLSVNGKDIGVMAVEEHFSKELLESQRRREGVIFRFDESDFWRNLQLNGSFGPYGNPHVSRLKPFRSGKVAKSPGLSADYAAAVGLMRGFLAGALRPDEVFNVEAMARFMAVCEVWRTYHPLAWHNMRYYYNPLTARIEPIGFDGNVQGAPGEPGLVSSRGGFTPLLLADDEFRAVYVRELRRIAGDMASGDLPARARAREAEIVPRLQEGLSFIEPLHLDALARRAERLASIDLERFDHFLPPLGDPLMQYPVPLQASLCMDCDTPRIELTNVLPVGVDVLGLSVEEADDADGASQADEAVADSLDWPIEVPATPAFGEPTLVSIALPADTDRVAFAATLEVRVRGQSQRHEIPVMRSWSAASRSPIPISTLEETLEKHPFLSPSADGTSLVSKPGRFEVDGSLVLPEGLGLHLTAGTELRFGTDAIAVTSGPLRFEGTPDAPVRLGPVDGVDAWGGLVSLRSDRPHYWRHVIVERTSGIQRAGWRLTGGVTIRTGQVDMARSRFEGHRGEDALNLIRSQFVLDSVDFHDTPSDALDADFSDGEIRGGRYTKIGGDGIDVSGAKITVDGAVLEDIEDKAISVGEASDLIARNVQARRVGSGAASKDASRLLFEDSLVEDAATAGVSVYTKKPEYGPAQATLERVEMRNVATEALVQEGSAATLDGVEAAVIPFDTDILY